MARTDECKLLAEITLYVHTIPLSTIRTSLEYKTLFIFDGNAILHALIDVLLMFEVICLKTLDNHPNDIDCLFATDMYNNIFIKS